MFGMHQKLDLRWGPGMFVFGKEGDQCIHPLNSLKAFEHINQYAIAKKYYIQGRKWTTIFLGLFSL